VPGESSTPSGLVKEIRGEPVPPVSKEECDRLSKDIESLRKSCEWLVTLGAANVIGNVLKLSATPAAAQDNKILRRATLVVIGVEIALALLGALQFDHGKVDYSEVTATLERNRRWRYRLRNVALFLLVVGFVLLGLQNW